MDHIMHPNPFIHAQKNIGLGFGHSQKKLDFYPKSKKFGLEFCVNSIFGPIFIKEVLESTESSNYMYATDKF